MKSTPIERLEILRHPVVAVGLGMIAVQAIVRGWAVYGSWFFADDYVLLRNAQDRPVSVDYLLSDFNSNLIPAVRLLASVVERSGELNWGLAATIVLVLQIVASLAALTMLVSLFGTRWAILAPLALYLTSAVTMPAYMWWVASVSQLPFQLCFFLAVTTWVTYHRTRQRRFMLMTLSLVVFALFCYTKSLFIVPVLAYLTAVYFVTGTVRERVRTLALEFWFPILATGSLVIGYVAYYVTQVPQPFEEARTDQTLDVIGTFLTESVPVGILGGPWNWFDTTPPVVLAGAPAWTVHLSWVIIAAIVAVSVLKRHRVTAGWLLLFGYAVGLAVLLATSRGQLFGSLTALEYRYLTDIVCAATLCLGLVFLPLRGAPGSSEAREAPLLTVSVSPWVPVGLIGAVSIGGLFSTVQYVGYWHNDNAGKVYTANLREDLARTPNVELASQLIPGVVMPDYTEPVNTTEDFVRLFDAPASFPSTADQLRVVDEEGHLVRPVVETGFLAEEGPIPDCGWSIDSAGGVIPLIGSTFDFDWWMRIAYVSSSDSPVTVSAGDDSRQTRVRPGLQELYVQASGVFESIEFEDLDPGTTLCVDKIEVGFLSLPEGDT